MKRLVSTAVRAALGAAVLTATSASVFDAVAAEPAKGKTPAVAPVKGKTKALDSGPLTPVKGATDPQADTKHPDFLWRIRAADGSLLQARKEATGWKIIRENGEAVADGRLKLQNGAELVIVKGLLDATQGSVIAENDQAFSLGPHPEAKTKVR